MTSPRVWRGSVHPPSIHPQFFEQGGNIHKKGGPALNTRDGAIPATPPQKILTEARCFASVLDLLERRRNLFHALTSSKISCPNTAASFSAVDLLQLLPVRTAVTVQRESPAFSASWFPLISKRASAAANFTRSILTVSPPIFSSSYIIFSTSNFGKSKVYAFANIFVVSRLCI